MTPNLEVPRLTPVDLLTAAKAYIIDAMNDIKNGEQSLHGLCEMEQMLRELNSALRLARQVLDDAALAEATKTGVPQTLFVSVRWHHLRKYV